MTHKSFAELDLVPELLRAVAEAGYTKPTPIQGKAIPVILAGKDVMGGAQTGTGKTAGFALPILQRLVTKANNSPSPARHPVRALILTPTRELAVQVEESFRTYGKYTNLRSTVVYGGVDIKQQLSIVRAGVEILVATPGRLLDHIEQKSVNLGQVEVFVLDEADRMLDMGFIPDIKRIMALLPATAKRQNLLFSATFSGEIKKLADQLLNAPQLIEAERRNTAAETVSQSAYKVPTEAKRALLEHLVRTRNLKQVLCFVRTKHGTARLARALAKDGLVTDAIHGDKTQQARMEALAAFKDGKLQVLVATDVAARGLDIDDLPLVVNFELPHVPEDYIHRIGRTGRAGASGEAISFVAPEEEKHLAEIERLLKKPIAIAVAGDFDPSSVHTDRSTQGGRLGGSAHSQRSRPVEHARSGTQAQSSTRGRTQAPASARGEDAVGTARTGRSTHAKAAAVPHRPREDPRIERERAYARNPDQPTVARKPAASAGGSALTPGSAPSRRHGSGHARPVAALLRKKRTSSEPEKV